MGLLYSNGANFFRKLLEMRPAHGQELKRFRRTDLYHGKLHRVMGDLPAEAHGMAKITRRV